MNPTGQIGTIKKMRELSDDIPARLLRDLAAAPLVPEEEINAYVRNKGPLLTADERLALLMLSHGLTHNMVAELLGKSAETIKVQTKTARYKLRAKNTAHAISLALRAGLLD